ncbi:Myb family transcription factor [Striga asiatica]|uniref:Myb family transcription factor n=1 Tax=Striga asiatica TaxID=4170 RepID=A0A5A7PAY7_STRAF|nr:Myb family transcription factor [Striga asiatica]
MRKSLSMNNMSEYEPACKDGGSRDAPRAAAVDGSSTGYAAADDTVPRASNRNRERRRGKIGSNSTANTWLEALPTVVLKRPSSRRKSRHYQLDGGRYKVTDI